MINTVISFKYFNHIPIDIPLAILFQCVEIVYDSTASVDAFFLYIILYYTIILFELIN